MILEALCRGNYIPPDLITPTDSDYWEINHQVGQTMDLLRTQLSEANYTLVEQLVDKIYKAHCFECEAYYKLGFATGMAIERETQELRTEKAL